jgi:hypothetical protein
MRSAEATPALVALAMPAPAVASTQGQAGGCTKGQEVGFMLALAAACIRVRAEACTQVRAEVSIPAPVADCIQGLEVESILDRRATTATRAHGAHVLPAPLAKSGQRKTVRNHRSS